MGIEKESWLKPDLQTGSCINPLMVNYHSQKLLGLLAPTLPIFVMWASGSWDYTNTWIIPKCLIPECPFPKYLYIMPKCFSWLEPGWTNTNNIIYILYILSGRDAKQISLKHMWQFIKGVQGPASYNLITLLLRKEVCIWSQYRLWKSSLTRLCTVSSL